MKILTFSTLYPSSVSPTHGIFVQQRLRQLLAYSPDIEVKVMAPVPWFPSTNPRFGEYSDYAKVPNNETRYGIEVLHPRYPLFPKIGMNTAPLSIYLAIKSRVKKLIESGFDFDLIDAHYFYPDGVAAVMLGRKFNKPVVITGRGTDLNLIPQYKIPAKQIKWAAENADALITVAGALKQYLVDMDVPADKVTVLRNGVDLDVFKPVADRDALRQALDISGRTIMSVGFLRERKGHHLIIEALRDLPDINLLVVGEGPHEQKLKNQVESLGLADRVRFTGRIAQEKLFELYAAVDALVLASSREGWANVLLESMACGTPVAATAIDGTPEVVRSAEAGVLIRERTPESIRQAITELFNHYPDRQQTRKYAEQFGWDETSQGQLNIFHKIMSGQPHVS